MKKLIALSIFAMTTTVNAGNEYGPHGVEHHYPPPGGSSGDTNNTNKNKNTNTNNQETYTNVYVSDKTVNNNHLNVESKGGTGGNATAQGGQGGQGGNGGQGGIGGQGGVGNGGAGGVGNGGVANATGGTSNAAGGNANSSSGGGNSSVGNTSQNINFREERRPVNSAIAPALATGDCMGSTSVGGSAAAISLSFGTTWRDSDCVMRKKVLLLSALDMKIASWQMACQDDAMGKAIRASGEYNCKDTVQQIEEMKHQRDKLAEAEEAIRQSLIERGRQEQQAMDRHMVEKEQERLAMSAKTPLVREFGVPPYVEPQACRPVPRNKRKTVKPC